MPLDAPFDPPSDAVNGDSPAEETLSWNDLTRLAREASKRGQLAEANERLSMAAIQVASLGPTHVRRRTVFGLRARLALELAESGDLEAGDQLADQLFAESESDPLVGGPALVTLALSIAERREQADGTSYDAASQLALLRTALITAQAGSVSRDRMELAAIIARRAEREEEHELARMAIDQALSDARQTIPADKNRLIALQLERAEIALAGGDFEAAQKSATSANQRLDEMGASASHRGIGEALLAEILAATGEVETALVVASGAHARIGGDERITNHAKRRILAALARVEERAGDPDSARVHFTQALAVPGSAHPGDNNLVRRITRERADLNTTYQP